MISSVAPTRLSTFYAYLITKIGNRNLKAIICFLPHYSLCDFQDLKHKLSTTWLTFNVFFTTLIHVKKCFKIYTKVECLSSEEPGARQKQRAISAVQGITKSNWAIQNRLRYHNFPRKLHRIPT